MSKTFSKCQDCQRMEYIVDGGTVCESCLRHTTQAKVLLSHADSEIESLRTQLAAARERVKEAEEFANTAVISVSDAQEQIEQLTERAVRAEKLMAECKEARKEASDGNGC